MIRFVGWICAALFFATPALAEPQYFKCDQTDAAPNEKPMVMYLRILLLATGNSVDFSVDTPNTGKWKADLVDFSDSSLKVTDDTIEWNPMLHLKFDRHTNVLTGGMFVSNTYQCTPYTLE